MRKVLKEVFNTSLLLLIVLVLIYLVIHFVGQRTQVIGESMESTVNDGDNLIVDKITYHFKEPIRYDIIVFPFQYAKDTFYIKRIIGLPGETVQIDESGTIYIDGDILSESYGKEIIRNPGIASREIILSADEYFVLGDNRNNSSDSRDPVVGNIHRDDIVGRAWVRIWPFSSIGVLRHQ